MQNNNQNNLIIQISDVNNKQLVKSHKINQFPINIGRGFNNDIIINDQYISKNHLNFDVSEDGNWVIKDLDSLNGVMFNGNNISQKTFKLNSGDQITIGDSIISFFDTNHEIEETKTKISESGFFKLISQQHISWAVFFVVGFLSAIWTYFEEWSIDAVENAVSSGVGGLVVILLWSVMWGIAGRIIYNRKTFSGNLGLASIWLLSMGVLHYFKTYLEFITSGNSISYLFIIFLNSAMVSALIFGCLTLIGGMAVKRRIATSIIFSVSLLVGIFGFQYIGKKQTILKPEYSNVIQPGIVKILPSTNVPDFISGLDKSFEKLKK